MSRSRLVFIVFYLTAILIATVHLRTVSSRLFYRFRTAVVARDRIKSQLWQKQIQLESLINPSAISEYIEQDQEQE
jgi:hypothetical protein